MLLLLIGFVAGLVTMSFLWEVKKDKDWDRAWKRTAHMVLPILLEELVRFLITNGWLSNPF
ncbi:MAG: hypothetical protein V1838_02590 [Patescibacteria group bacterium]